ncbi:MAG: hypothetical protein HOK80_02830 [Candidatus Cloacimonetes bacterium]|jgi:hypothetical protein|nr:hypothetical protein [Candidatus Cloacimonadota bacterium]MBT4332805.1 hypothetical protein [Candidatus Cloacimonadota bacterium]MBT4575622.1 hypothetical protein [Candidatus Cloacimonadota bacterium]MBT5419799.1 hypothetical protein [Candidatus Cloacimonadota bacterium]
MRNLLNYIVPFLVLILVFRFFNFIIFYAIRFWYVSIPLILYFLYEFNKSRKKRSFKHETGLDPGDEVKLKEDPVIEDEDK